MLFPTRSRREERQMLLRSLGAVELLAIAPSGHPQEPVGAVPSSAWS